MFESMEGGHAGNTNLSAIYNLATFFLICGRWSTRYYSVGEQMFHICPADHDSWRIKSELHCVKEIVDYALISIIQ